MATKSQLKQYFETGKIPTQAQFGELINSFINIPYLNTEDRGNQNLFLVMEKRILIFKVLEL